MKPYSDYAPRAVLQVFVDVLAISVIAMWVNIGMWIHDEVVKLTAFGVQMENAGAGFRRTLTDVGDRLEEVPLIGSDIRVPFDAASNAGAQLEAAGIAQQDAFSDLALGLGVVVAGLPILAVLVLWLVPRLRFALRAHATKKLAATQEGLDLFALRAILSRKPGALMAVTPDPAGAWRAQDEVAIKRLAQLEMRHSGVRLSAP